MTKIMGKIQRISAALVLRTKAAVFNNRGDGYIDVAIRILLAVVIGALLLAGLYALFGEMIMPQLRDRIQDMFNYAG